MLQKQIYRVPTDAFWFPESLSSTLCFLNSNDPKAWNYLAFGEKSRVSDWASFTKKEKGEWYYGFLGYDLKEPFLFQREANSHWFPPLFMFSPEWVVRYKPGYVEVFGDVTAPKSQFNALVDDLFLGNLQSGSVFKKGDEEIRLTPKTPHHQYIWNVKQIKKHIQRGDIYEANYCQEFFAAADLDPISTYWSLNKKARPPFSAYLQFDDFRIISGSPERYIRREGKKVFSQPIKGTAPRGATPSSDTALGTELSNNRKERSENIMIVDLVRNDLSKIAEKGSVAVTELCGLHKFPTVFQLISTVEAQVREGVEWHEILRSTFPMGSMTGAPKKRAVEITDQLEDFHRGAYSGAIGYIDPEQDFDFNVVIRSILYDKEKSYISVPVGGAITINSDPEKEYQECLTKIKAIRELFEK